MKLNECVNEYIDYQLSEGKDYNKTIKKYVSNINEMIKYLNINTVEELDNITYIEMRMQWINKKKGEGLSNQSINLRIASVRSFLEYMVGMRYIHENVANHIHKERVQAKKVEVNEDKIKDMLQLIDNEFKKDPNFLTIRNKYMVTLLLTTGMRSSEIRNIKLSDINLKGEFKIVGKYSKVRNMVIPSKLIKLHRQYLLFRDNLPYVSEYLFVSQNGNQLDKNIINTYIKKYAEQVNLDWTTHSTRKSYITTSLNSGVAIEDVASAVGHTSCSTTLKSYYNPNVDHLRDSIDNNKILEII